MTLALVASGCGDDTPAPAPPAPPTTATAGPAPLVEPTPELEPETITEPETLQLLEPQPQPQHTPSENTAAATTEREFPVEPDAASDTEPGPPVEPEPEPVQAEPVQAEPQPEPDQAEPQPVQAEPQPEPDQPEPAQSEPELVPCPEGEHRHGDEPCHYDDPEPEPVQAEAPPEDAVVEVEDEPDSDEVHPHSDDTIPEPPPASGVFPSARGEQPTIAWQVHVSGIVEGARPLPTFTPVVQAWSDWCFFDWVARSPNKAAMRQQCAIALGLIGMATELMGITDQCATRQYRGQLEMMRGEGEFDFATDFGRVGWHACPSVIDPDPSDDIPSPYFDADLYAASLMPGDDCTRASWAAEVYLQQHSIWMAEWRC